MDSYEHSILVKNEVFVFKIPARTSLKGYRAADWNLNVPDWCGRMRLVEKDSRCILYLEDKTSGQLYAKCPVDAYPGLAIEPVSDSSRFFVIRIQDDSGRSAFLGFGFTDRADSFDFNVALQDHFKLIKKTEEFVKEQQEPKQELDLRFKEGETIKINMKITKKDGTEVLAKKKLQDQALKGQAGNSGFIKILPPPGSVKNSPSHQPAIKTNWNNFQSAPLDDSSIANTSASSTGGEGDTSNNNNNTGSNSNWIQF